MEKILHQNEKIVRSTKGAIDIGALSTLWRPGNLCLTNQRIMFERQGRIQFSACLKDIVDVKLEMREWILQHTRQLCISCLANPSESTRVTYIAVASPRSWQMSIKESITLALIECEFHG